MSGAWLSPSVRSWTNRRSSLDPGYRQVPQHRDGGVPGAEVVQMDTDTKPAQGLQGFQGGFGQAQGRSLGDLEDLAGRGRPGVR